MREYGFGLPVESRTLEDRPKPVLEKKVRSPPVPAYWLRTRSNSGVFKVSARLEKPAAAFLAVGDGAVPKTLGVCERSPRYALE